jgi:hypothetical protein
MLLKVLNGEMKFDCVDCNAAVQQSLELVRSQKVMHLTSARHYNTHQIDQDIKYSPHSEVSGTATYGPNWGESGTGYC